MAKPLTATQKAEYIAKGGWKCPFCASSIIDGDDCSHEGGEIRQTIKCLSCKRTWIDCYKLYDIEDDPDEEDDA